MLRLIRYFVFAQAINAFSRCVVAYHWAESDQAHLVVHDARGVAAAHVLVADGLVPPHVQLVVDRQAVHELVHAQELVLVLVARQLLLLG